MFAFAFKKKPFLETSMFRKSFSNNHFVARSIRENIFDEKWGLGSLLEVRPVHPHEQIVKERN